MRIEVRSESVFAKIRKAFSVRFKIVRTIAPVLAIAMVLSLNSPAWSHSGRTNSSGCHHNHRTGDYHCHGGGSGTSTPRTHCRTETFTAYRSTVYQGSRVFRTSDVEASRTNFRLGGRDGILSTYNVSDLKVRYFAFIDSDNKNKILVSFNNGDWVRVNTFAEYDSVRTAQFAANALGITREEFKTETRNRRICR
ncbi:MAG: YHYH domain-containing protein [Cyanobacteria bacterium SBLK]|nr:YHYH domain-containing protein [Cyanobacteria bacterium SBLK]